MAALRMVSPALGPLMLQTPFLLSAVFLASLPGFVASNPVSVPIYRTQAASLPIQAILAIDRSGPGVSITNFDSNYVAETTVGTQTFSLIVDTGSSTTWVGAGSTKFIPGSATDTGRAVSVDYGTGSFSGTQYIDNVSLGGLTASQQSIGVAKTSSGFPDWVDGILGLGPEDLTENTVEGVATVSTFMQNLQSEGQISANVLGVSFAPEPASSNMSANGQLDLGGTDSSKYSGSITYAPISSTSSVSRYWGIDVTGITYGSTSLTPSVEAAIVDTGTTLILLPPSVYSNLQTTSGGETDSETGLLSWLTKPTEDVAFTIGGTQFMLTPAQYLVPTAQYSNFHIPAGKYYAWITDGGPETPNFLLGEKFLENYYSVFDTDNQRVGLATSVPAS